MNTQDYTALFDQVARQTPELADYDAQILAAQAALAAADEDGKAAVQVVLDGLTLAADPIRAAISQCQAEMTASGLAPNADDMAAARLHAAAPRTVTMRQARLALLGAGYLAAVDTAINAMPSPQKEAARIEWEYSQEVHRDKALVQALAPALGLSDTQISQLFITAAAL